ncbi:MAG: ABC transporter substrate-binding protein [Phycisphaerales bacterium]
MTRPAARISLLIGCLAALLLWPSACSRRDGDVVLYSSVDDQFLREVVGVFEKESGLSVRIVGDTEATKTTGLVERLIAEKARPRADVWWSSEPFGTIRLAREGILEPFTPAGDRDFEDGWPLPLRAPDRSWHAFATRDRVLVYNSRKLAPRELPRTLRDLAAERFKGRVGIARPQFGTTRGHMGALLHDSGEPAFRAWLESLKASGVRLYDGNATVVRAVAYGEIDLALTDSDDVHAGLREGWPIAMALIGQSLTEAPSDRVTLAVPNTAARVRGGRNAEGAARLLDFLLSERVERMLAESESRNTPIRLKLVVELGLTRAPGTPLDLGAIADSIPGAMRVCDEVCR